MSQLRCGQVGDGVGQAHRGASQRLQIIHRDRGQRFAPNEVPLLDINHGKVGIDAGHLSPGQRQRTARRRTDPAAIMARRMQIRKRGFGQINQQLGTGPRPLAGPPMPARGQTSPALNGGGRPGPRREAARPIPARAATDAGPAAPTTEFGGAA